MSGMTAWSSHGRKVTRACGDAARARAQGAACWLQGRRCLPERRAAALRTFSDGLSNAKVGVDVCLRC